MSVSDAQYEEMSRRVLAAMQRLEMALLENAQLKIREAVLQKLLAQARGETPAPTVPPATDGKPRQLLLDIHRLARSYRQTGIERVLAGLVGEFLRKPPEGFRTEPVYVGDDGTYRYARKFTARLEKRSEEGIAEEPVDGGPGDVFVQLDIGIFHCLPMAHLCLKLSRQGVRIYYVVYDLLPLLHPHWFLPNTQFLYATWLRAASQLADGFLCISKSVATDLVQWFNRNRPERPGPVRIDWFHLGSDIDSSLPTDGVPEGFDQAIVHLKQLPVVLMVGTVEPRKGYLQAFAAFDRLWRQGTDAYLVIVGKKGWAMEPLWDLMEKHPEAGRRLLWFQAATDEMLLKLYGAASGLLMTSEGEGFGLPLIEAARHRLPILTRDLPVFREVAGNHASYFSGTEPEALATALEAWLKELAAGTARPSAEMPLLTWEESYRELSDALFGERRRLQWPSPAKSS